MQHAREPAGSGTHRVGGARRWAPRRSSPGARLRDVCEAVEDEIHRRGGALAFPVQSSRNDIAAHYCPSPEDETVYEAGDLAKLDLGVHVDGWVVDTALTVNVGDVPGEPAARRRRASRALEAAIAAAARGRAGAPALRGHRADHPRRAASRRVRNLCGHGVGTLRGPLPAAHPERGRHGAARRLQAGAVVAIEPFATDGPGHVAEEGGPEVFRLDPGAPPRPARRTPTWWRRSARSHGLPFARRQLAGFDRAAIDETARLR